MQGERADDAVGAANALDFLHRIARSRQIRKVAAFCDDAIHTAVVAGASAGRRRFADSRNTPCRPVWAQLPGSHERADSARFLLRPGGNSERDRLSDWTLVQVNPNSGQAISRAPRTHALARQGGQGGYHES